MRWTILPLALVCALELGATPRLEVEPGDKLILTALPLILSDAQVRPHLTTGLTTTFAFRVTVLTGGGKLVGGSQVEIRYEPWDEIYHVAVMGIDGRIERHTVASFGDLSEWWKTLRLGVLDARHADWSAASEARITVAVVPFSQAEGDDTRRWFSESLERASRSSAEEIARSAEDGPEPLGRALNLLIATSIRRRALLSYRWTVAVPVEPSP